MPRSSSSITLFSDASSINNRDVHKSFGGVSYEKDASGQEGRREILSSVESQECITANRLSIITPRQSAIYKDILHLLKSGAHNEAKRQTIEAFFFDLDIEDDEILFTILNDECAEVEADEGEA